MAKNKKARTEDRPREVDSGPFPVVSGAPRPTEDRQLTSVNPLRVPPGREKARADFLEAKRLEACKRICQNCAFALRPTTKWFRIILASFPGLLACFNRADAPGEMVETTRLSTCRHFRYRHQSAFRLEPPTPPGPGIRVIPLTKGKHAYVDEKDYDRIAKHKWAALYADGKWYAVRNDHGRSLLMHREIMNAPKGKVVDHFDGNGLNNCQSNLRLCTYSQNNTFRRPYGASSRYKCVYHDRKRDLWWSRPQYRGRRIYNGGYASEVEAARASDYKNVQFNGEFAYLNLPTEWPKERIQEVYEAGQAQRDRLDAISDKRQVTSGKKDTGQKSSTAEDIPGAKVKRRRVKG
jgi:hypothetical protein